MRKILFRAKRLKDSKWVEGMLTKDVKSHYRIQFDPEKFSVVVIPETICQFTGLTDKNGTNIFEGDIVNIKSGEEYMYIIEIDKNCVVKFSYGSFNPVDIDEVHYDFGNIDEFEVIGNIFDSPELLK